MFQYPYGDGQQLNLNWIINEIINLHKQLDPDYETPSFTQIYPYSNLNQLNLDWILSELKTLKELAPEPTPTLDIQAVAEALVALPFDSNTSYQIYDFISKDGEIWRATEAIPAGSAWDSTKWFKTKLGTDLAVLERWINAINNSLTSLQNTVADLDSADIADDSDAGGATVKASLNNLKGSIDAKFPVSVANGGTGETTIADAKTAFGFGQLTSGIVTVNANTTTIINVPNNARALLIAFGSAGFFMSVSVSSSGVVSYQEYWKASTITIATYTRQLEVTNSSTANVACGWLDFLGKTIT